MSKRLYWDVVATLFFAWFAAALVFSAIQQPLVYDDAYNAAVSRNIADGKGWVTDYHATVPFNSTVTSGPTLLLPAAVLINFLGVKLWIPALSNVLLMLSGLLLYGLALRRLTDSTSQYLAVVIATLVFLGLYDTRAWSEFVGDGFIPIAVAAVSVLLVCVLERKSGGEALVLAGVLLGLTLLSKLYGVIAILGLLAALLWCLGRAWIQGTPLRLVRLLGPLFLGAGCILLPWLLYKAHVLSALSEEVRAQRAIFDAQFFKAFGSGIDGLYQADDLFAYMWGVAQRNFSGLVRSFEIPQWWAGGWVFALFCLPLITGLVLAFRREVKGYALLLFLLAGAASAHWIWFMCISTGAPRYARIAIILSCMILALLLSLRLRSWLVPAALAVAVVMLPPAKKETVLGLALFKTAPADALAAQKNFIRAASVRGEEGPLVGCNWAVSRLLDYAAPEDQPLKDVVLLLSDALNSERESGAAHAGQMTELANPLQFRFAISEMEWAFHKSIGTCPIPQYLDSVCDQPLFNEGFYTIKRCTISHVPPALADALHKSYPNHLSGMH
ncbi:hypothetical protein [Pseudomonas sp.]|uniref:hypothetical protein n=1 Tax=Pseudomonas sp. TaxID=306 RepID=UPI003BB62241